MAQTFETADAYVEAMQPLAKALARRHTACSMEAEDFAQELILNLLISIEHLGGIERIRQPRSLARMMMGHVIMGEVRRRAKLRENISGETALLHLPAPRDEEAALRDYFDALEERHGRIARAIAENVYAPKEPRVCEFILREAKVKETRARKQRGEGALRRPRISARAVRRGLGVDSRIWAREMKKVKAFTASWFGRTSSEAVAG